ncbi:MAG: hypothetical protein J7M34_01815 [Anaerolineae bacterium]|nr:hypothetical protein [Anaerolineae bacterium]
MGERCYICSAPAVTRCRTCGRPICREHLVPYPEELRATFGPDGCQHCVEWAIETISRGRQQRERKRAQDVVYRTCAVCHRVFDQVLPACSVCGRRVCSKHSTRYRRRFHFGNRKDPVTGAWYWEYDVRCIEHPRRLWWDRLWGWQIDPRTEEYVEATPSGRVARSPLYRCVYLIRGLCQRLGLLGNRAGDREDSG